MDSSGDRSKETTIGNVTYSGDLTDPLDALAAIHEEAGWYANLDNCGPCREHICTEDHTAWGEVRDIATLALKAHGRTLR